MIYSVAVGIALSRPPKRDATIYCVVHVDGEVATERGRNQARLTACHMAGSQPRVVMPVSAVVVAERMEVVNGNEG